MNTKEFLEKAKSFTGKTISKAAKTTVVAGKKIAKAEIPPSINWIYGFGFKVGVFDCIHSVPFVVCSNHRRNDNAKSGIL